MTALRTLRALLAATLVAAALVCAAQMPSGAPSRKPVWEVVRVEDSPAVTPGGAPELDVAVLENGKILITSDRPVTVKVFSILGQLITEKQIQAGTVRLTMDARGIYILKADNTTRRISL